MINNYSHEVNNLFLPIIPVMNSSQQNGITLYDENGIISSTAYYMFDNDNNTYYEPLLGGSIDHRFKIEFPEAKTVIGCSFKLAPGAQLKNFYLMTDGIPGSTIGYYDFRDNPITYQDGLIVLNSEYIISSTNFVLNIPNDGYIVDPSYGDKIRIIEFQLYINTPPQGTQRVRTNQIRSNTINYKSLYEQMDGMIIPYDEIIIANQGQTEVAFNTNYRSGINLIDVYLNGQLVKSGASNDYIELTPKSIKFNYLLNIGDIVRVRIEGSGNGTLREITRHIIEKPMGPINGVNNIFVLTYPLEKDSEEIYLNGALMCEGSSNDYIINEQTITFNFPIPTDSKIKVNYKRNILPYV